MLSACSTWAPEEAHGGAHLTGRANARTLHARTLHVHASWGARRGALRIQARNRMFLAHACKRFRLSILNRNWYVIFCIECLFCHIEACLLGLLSASVVFIYFLWPLQSRAWFGHVLFSRIVVRRRLCDSGSEVNASLAVNRQWRLVIVKKR